MHDLKLTPLYELHQELGARMVEFAGYSMPLQYQTGIKTEHLHSRNAAGLFDVSHMGQLSISGPGSAIALEWLMPVELESLGINSQRYGMLLNNAGGIIDDLIITRRSADTYGLVVNAARKDIDLSYLREHLSAPIKIQAQNDLALLALQGPQSAAVLQDDVNDLDKLTFMQAMPTKIFGIDCYLSRSGYTGEDGFEISLANKRAADMAKQLLKHPAVLPIGLGARDSLRLEAGLCLYGQDMDERTTPVQAGLGWSISKSRKRGGMKAGGYAGASIIETQQKNGTAQKRIGLLIRGRAPARTGASLIDPDSQAIIGEITSGCFSPSLEQPIAMGVVNREFAHVGTALQIAVRNRKIEADVVKLPFIAPNYYRG